MRTFLPLRCPYLLFNRISPVCPWWLNLSIWSLVPTRFHSLMAPAKLQSVILTELLCFPVGQKFSPQNLYLVIINSNKIVIFVRHFRALMFIQLYHSTIHFHLRTLCLGLLFSLSITFSHRDHATAACVSPRNFYVYQIQGTRHMRRVKYGQTLIP